MIVGRIQDAVVIQIGVIRIGLVKKLVVLGHGEHDQGRDIAG